MQQYQMTKQIISFEALVWDSSILLNMFLCIIAVSWSNLFDFLGSFSAR